MSAIIKVRHENQSVEIEVASQAAWDALRPREQHAEVAKAIEIEKRHRAERIEKGLDEISKAELGFGSLVEAHAAKHNVSEALATAAVCDTPEGAAAYKRMVLVKRDAPLTPVTKSTLDNANAALDALEAEALAFGKLHNLEPAAARQRLGQVDPSYNDRFREAYNARAQASIDAHYQRTEFKLAQAEKRKAVVELVANHDQSVHKNAVDAQRVPSERALEKYAEDLATKRGVSVAKAMADALTSDEHAKRLYKAAHAEKIQRAAGGR